MTKNVVLFCGGRGSATIIKELLDWPDTSLTLIANAYDDGKSTGALRLFIPGMLGPSDFRKNISYLLDLAIPENQILRDILEYRFSEGATERDVYHYAITAIENQLGIPSRQLMELLTTFSMYSDQFTTDRDDGSVGPFDYSDCSMGNLIFAGAYLQSGSFNGAVAMLSDLFKLRARLLNVSKGECCVLQALKEDGTLLPNEAAIVGEQSDVPIHSYYLVSEPVTQEELDRPALVHAVSDDWLRHCVHLLRYREAKVEISPEAAAAIMHADVIIYGPGTQHSSLLPSYRIAKAHLQISPAPVKVIVTNLEQDHDIQGLSASNLVDNALRDMGDPDNEYGVITHILCNIPQIAPTWLGPGHLGAEPYKGAKVIWSAYEDAENPKVHDGKLVVKVVKSLCQK